MSNQSASDVIYEDRRVRITPRTLEIGPTSYPFSKIESVMQPLQLPFEIFGGFLLNGALFLFGLWCIAQLTIGWILGGLVAAAIGGFNVRGQFNRPWWVTVKAGGEEVRIQRTNKDEIDRIYVALRTAIEQQ
jgi:hypothetical protein